MIRVPNLIGAICATQDEQHRLLQRVPRLPHRQLLPFAPVEASRSNVDEGRVDASFFGFLASSSLLRWRSPEPDGSTLLVAFSGHLLVDGGAECIEGVAAVERLCSIYGRDGAAGFAALSGNFAFTLVDALRGTWLVRDAAGTKPLFVAKSDTACATVFGASAIEVSRLARGNVMGDRDALQDYLRCGRAPVAGRTLLEGVEATASGHALRVDARGAAEALQQRPSLTLSAAGKGIDAAAPELLRLLLAVTAAQSQQSTTASALSGGTDSSAILAAMHCARDRQPRCFTFSHDHRDLASIWHERVFAQQAAERFKAEVTFVGLLAQALPQLLSEVCSIQDFPFGSPVVMAQAHLFRTAAAAGIDRMLSGHGPDSLFGGGTSHLIARAADMVAGGRMLAATRLLIGGRHYADVSTLRLVAAVAAQTLRPRATRDPMQDRLSSVIADQLYDSVVPVSLITEECNARAYGIENRLPFLVREMLMLAASLSPDAVLPADGETKAMLRRAMADRLPPAILSRKRAVGFAVPVLPWLLELGDWLGARLDDLRRFPFIPTAPAGTVIEALQRRDVSAWQCAFRVWRWLILAEWIEAHDVRFD